VTVEPTGAQGEDGEQGRARTNVVLYVVTLLCLAAVVFAATLMWNQHADDGGDRSGGWLGDAWAVVTDRREGDTVAALAGTDVGPGVVEALATAPEGEQERSAAQIEAARTMADAFLNISHETVAESIGTVKSLSTGTFLEQYTKAADDLTKLTTRAKATQKTDIVWVGLVAGDDDSARVIIATTGTVANKITDFEPRARSYRLQIDLKLVDGQWLTSDLQYVE
jgi:hypothetical protein